MNGHVSRGNPGFMACLGRNQVLSTLSLDEGHLEGHW